MHLSLLMFTLSTIESRLPREVPPEFENEMISFSSLSPDNHKVTPQTANLQSAASLPYSETTRNQMIIIIWFLNSLKVPLSCQLCVYCVCALAQLHTMMRNRVSCSHKGSYVQLLSTLL